MLLYVLILQTAYCTYWNWWIQYLFQISAAKTVQKQDSVEKDNSDSEKQDNQNPLVFDELGGKCPHLFQVVIW